MKFNPIKKISKAVDTVQKPMFPPEILANCVILSHAPPMYPTPENSGHTVSVLVKSRRGRPRKPVADHATKLSVTIPADMAKRVKERARERGMSVSCFVSGVFDREFDGQ